LCGGRFQQRLLDPTKPVLIKPYKSEQRASLRILKMSYLTARKGDIGRSFGRTGRYQLSRRFSSSPWKTGSHFKVREIEESLSQLQVTYRVSQFAGMFLGLGLILRSYHIRELLACWLFFSLVFVLLALIVFGISLAFCTGERVVHWARAAAQVTPIVDFIPGELRVKTILDDRK